MRKAWAAALLFLAVLVGSISLPSAATSAPSAPESLQTLAPVLEEKLKDWLVAWRTVQPGLKIEQFKRVRGSFDPWIPAWESVPPVAMDGYRKNPLSVLYVPSPDGRLVLNPFGGLDLTKVGPRFVISQQHDRFVLLIDRTMSRVRYIIGVEGGGYHEGVWLSKDGFIVAAWRYGDLELRCPQNFPPYQPYLALVNLSPDSLAFYHGPSSCAGLGLEYLERKINKKVSNLKS